MYHAFKNDNIEIMIGYETDEIIEEFFNSLLQKHQEGLEERMKGSEFIFDIVNLLYYKLYKTSLNHGGSYIDSPKWLKNKKATKKKNKKANDNDTWFQYCITVALNHQNIKDPQKIPKIKSFINQCKKKIWKCKERKIFSMA